MIVAGFGFRASVTQEALSEVLAAAAEGSAPSGPSALASAEDKATSEVFRAFAKGQGLPIAAIDAPRLQGQRTLTQSAQSQAHRGAGSVAEAAALAAIGPGATLIAPRVVSSDGTATCALAQSSGDTEL